MWSEDEEGIMPSSKFILDRLRIWVPAAVLPLIFLYIGLVISRNLAAFDGAVWVLLASWTLGLISFGIFLYMMRREARLVYGLIEAMAGVGAIVAAIVNSIRLLIMTPEETLFHGQNRFVVVFLLAAATYVLVRGLDNIGEGLPEGSRIQGWWNSIFPKKSG
jgi:hypothetical protein